MARHGKCILCMKPVVRRSRYCRGCFNKARVDTKICTKCGNSFIGTKAIICTDCRHQAKLIVYNKYDTVTRRHNICVECGDKCTRDRNRCLVCANKRKSGENSPSWKGGLTMNHGYVTVRVKKGTPAKGMGGFYKLQHRVIYEEYHGKIPKGWHVHHKNGVKTDNRIENLIALPPHEHHSKPHEVVKVYEAAILERDNKILELEKQLQEAHN